MNRLILTAGLALIGTSVSAAPVKYNFTGYIDDIRDISGNTNITSKVVMGQSFSGSLYYDAESSFSYIIEPNRFLFTGPADPFEATLSGKTFEGTSSQVQLFDNYSGYDQLFISTTDYSVPAPFSENTNYAVLRFQFREMTATTIKNGKLPTTISLADYQWLHFGFTGYTCPSCFTFHVAGKINNLQLASVPDNSTWSMFIIGFGIVGAFSRKGKKGSADISR